MVMNKVSLGKQGEGLAASLLKKNGYRIVGRNVRSRFGEIDLVARDGPALCFIEIKTRTGFRFGLPEESVTPQKRWRLTRLARWYLQFHRLEDLPVRFDVVSLLIAPDGKVGRSRLIRGAFDAVIQ